MTSARHIFTKEVCTSSKSWVAQGFPIIVNLNDGSKNQFNLLNFRRADFCQSMINKCCLQQRFLTGWVSWGGNNCVHDGLIKEHSIWQTDNAKNKYIKNSFQAQASEPSNRNLSIYTLIKYCATFAFIHITVFTLCCFKLDTHGELWIQIFINGQY